jgi:hypothetical protein
MLAAVIAFPLPVTDTAFTPSVIPYPASVVGLPEVILAQE